MVGFPLKLSLFHSLLQKKKVTFEFHFLSCGFNHFSLFLATALFSLSFFFVSCSHLNFNRSWKICFGSNETRVTEFSSFTKLYLFLYPSCITFLSYYHGLPHKIYLACIRTIRVALAILVQLLPSISILHTLFFI